jgi:hypothetical protein
MRSILRSVILRSALAALSAVSVHAAQAPSFTPVATIAAPAELIKVQAPYAYVAADKTLAVFDISDPTTPTRLGDYSFPNRISGFRVAGSLIYVAADLFGLAILDVSNARTPTLRGSLKTPGQARNVAVSGTTAVVADQVAGLDIVDVSNLAKPVLVGSVFLEGFATDVTTSGMLAYAADRPTGFYVVDLSKPKSLEPISALQSSNASNFRGQIEILQTPATGQTLAVVVTGQLQLYDVSNPAAPRELSAYRTPGFSSRVSLKDSLAYVADGPAGVQVVDFSIPSKPQIIGTYKTPSPARDVAVSDSLVFIVVGGGDVLILRQTQ